MRSKISGHLLLIFLVLSELVMASSSSDDYKKISANGKYGLANATTDEVIIEPVYDDIGWSDNSLVIVEGVIGFRKKEAWGLISLDGKKITNARYTSLHYFNDNLLIVTERSRSSILNKYGVINTKGNTLIPIIYERIFPAENHLIITENIGGKNKTGFANTKGKFIIPVEFSDIRPIGKEALAVKNNEGFSALFDLRGNRKSGFDFESISLMDSTRFLVNVYGRKGLIDKQGETIVSPIYREIRKEGSIYIGKTFNQWTLLDRKNELLQSLNFDKIYPISESSYAVQIDKNIGLISNRNTFNNYLQNVRIVEVVSDKIVIERNGKFGLINSMGQILLPINQDSIWVNHSFVMAKVGKLNGESWTPFDFEGRRLGLFSFEYFDDHHPNHIKARRNGKWGLLNNSGNELSPFLYDSLGDFIGGLAIATYQGRMGVINQQGNWVVTPYKDKVTLSSHSILYEQGTESGIISLNGDIVYRSQHTIQPLGELYLERNRDGQFILLDETGSRPVLEAVDTVYHAPPSLYVFKINNDWKVLNSVTKEVFKLNPEVQEIKRYDEDLISVRIDDQWGYLSEQGQISIANRYDSVQYFSEGFSAFKLLGKWGFIDRNERIAIQPNYDEATAFFGKLSMVRKGMLFGLVNPTGAEVLEVKYDKIERFKDYILIYSKGKVGLADKNGKLIRNPQFSSITQIDRQRYIITKNGKSGVISIEGLDIIPPIYKEIIPHQDKYLVLDKTLPAEVSLKLN